MLPVGAHSLALGSAPLRRPRTATQGTRDCHEFTVTCARMPARPGLSAAPTPPLGGRRLGSRARGDRAAYRVRPQRARAGSGSGAPRARPAAPRPSCPTRCAGAWRSRPQGGATRYSCGSWRARNAAARRPGAQLERVPDHHQTLAYITHSADRKTLAYITQRRLKAPVASASGSSSNSSPPASPSCRTPGQVEERAEQARTSAGVVRGQVRMG